MMLLQVIRFWGGYRNFMGRWWAKPPSPSSFAPMLMYISIYVWYYINRCRKVEPNVQTVWPGWGRWPSASVSWDHSDRRPTVATSIPMYSRIRAHDIHVVAVDISSAGIPIYYDLIYYRTDEHGRRSLATTTKTTITIYIFIIHSFE